MDKKLINKSTNHKMHFIGDCCLIFMLFCSIVYLFRSLSLSAFDSDTFFIIATGENIVKNGVVPTINPFVIHDGLKIIVQQWLFDVIIYYLYQAFGSCGIYIYSIVIAMATLYLLYKFIGLYTNNFDIKIFCLSLYCVSSAPFLVTRPTSLSFILCLLLLIIMETYNQQKKIRILIWCLPVSFIVVNIHASLWPMLFVLMLPFIAPNILMEALTSISSLHGKRVKSQELEKSSRNIAVREFFHEKKALLLTMLGMFLCGFINPNGIKGMFYVVLSYGAAISNNLIMELKSPTIDSISGVIVIGSIICLVLYLIFCKGQYKNSLIYMSLGTIILASIHQRNRWFLFFATLPIIAILLDNALAEKQKENIKRKISKIPFIFLLAALIIVATFLGPTEITDSSLSPIEAQEYLDTKNKDEIILYAEFNNGAYMEFKGYKVYMDARPELFQEKINGKEDIYDEYLGVAFHGTKSIADFIDKYSFTHMIVSDGNLLDGYMQACSMYSMVVDGNGYKLYELNYLTTD